ncbi:MAG TPA: hypothetical protein VHD32_12850 [Candidatus Didemnitutus sp.]|nr:hypothetical protein [Candidatus Didemnitutus sp.]
MTNAFRTIIPFVAFAAGIALRADAPPAKDQAAPPATTDLTITFVDDLSRSSTENFYFDHLDIAFHKAIAKRKWPVTLHVERFAANPPAHENELQVFFKGIKPEERDDLTFRAWLTFDGPAGKKDFGILRYQYYPRAAETMDDSVTKIMREVADQSLDKIESLLFPAGRPGKS